MTTTVVELIANLKHYPDNTKVVITDVDDVEFAIVDFKFENNIVNIVIGEIAIDEKKDEEEK
ncbi:MAG: hypothetical protein RMZ69_21565 [Nostoc sp. ChiQUE01a]|nr:hypothetical protein [Nostoc sp. ChiQUE01a]